MRFHHETVRRHAKRVHHHINRHALFWVAFLMYALIVSLQLTYPPDRAVPFARLGSESVGYKRFDDIAVKLNNYFLTAKASLRISDDRQVSVAVRDLGGEVDVDATAQRLTDYPLWSRLIPFSFVFVRPHVVSTDVAFNLGRVSAASERYATVLTVQPRDAGLKITDGRLVATADSPGSVVSADELEAALTNLRYGLVYTVVTVPHKTVSASKPSTYFTQVQSRAETVIALPITITVEGEQVRPSASDKASWLSIGEDQSGAALGINQTALDAYLSALQAKHTTPAGQTQVTRRDGQETARVEGAAGRTIDVATLRERLSDIITSGQNQSLVAAFVPVAPTVVVNKTYSATQAGLQAYVSDQASTRNVRISVQQLGGNDWSVAARDTESTVSASTYKLFVALVLFDRMDKGEITWDTPILDTNTRGCFERMIVASTNACAEEWIRQFGRTGINNFIWSKGFSRGTDFNNPEANHTTAADLARYFRGMQEGWLMSGWARDYLLDALHRHHYTKGIPSGSAAGDVRNKVGFLWDYSNDSAVVYHPRGTYVIAVMTKGLSFYAIADITREIEALMYP